MTVGDEWTVVGCERVDTGCKQPLLGFFGNNGLTWAWMDRRLSSGIGLVHNSLLGVEEHVHMLVKVYKREDP